MVFPDPYPPPPPQTLAHLPDLPQEDDMTAQWPQATGYIQPMEGINFDFDSLEALIAWEQGGIPEPIPDSQLGHDLVSIGILISFRNQPLTSIIGSRLGRYRSRGHARKRRRLGPSRRGTFRGDGFDASATSPPYEYLLE